MDKLLIEDMKQECDMRFRIGQHHDPFLAVQACQAYATLVQAEALATIAGRTDSRISDEELREIFSE